MAPEHGEPLRLQPCRISYLHPVFPPLRQCLKEPIQSGHKITSMIKVTMMEGGKLEHERTNLRLEWFTGVEKLLPEQGGIEEIGVHAPTPHTKPEKERELLHRYLIGHLEGKFESIWHLVTEAGEIGLRWKLVVGAIHSDRPVGGGIFSQARLVELRL